MWTFKTVEKFTKKLGDFFFQKVTFQQYYKIQDLNVKPKNIHRNYSKKKPSVYFSKQKFYIKMLRWTLYCKYLGAKYYFALETRNIFNV